MPKPIWTGAITFGLITIPVKLFSMARRRLPLELVHKEDKCPVGYAYICKNTGEVVNYSELARGYERADGEYVILDENDFGRANIEKRQAITIRHFVLEQEIESRYLAKPYYLTPDEGGKEVYALLRAALSETGKVAVAQYVLRNKENLGMIKAADGYLELTQLRYPAELVQAEQLPRVEETAVDQEQLDLSIELIQKLSTEFNPDLYEDTYTEELKRVIEEKKPRKKRRTKKEEGPTTATIQELLRRLEESVSQMQKQDRT